jgi:hypothetical protein
MRNSRGSLLAGGLILAGLLSLAVPAWPEPMTARMQRVVAQFVEQTGHRVVASGSWISGKGFNFAAGSDFDMRLVIEGTGTEAQQLAKWRQAQSKMAALIEKEFGTQAGAALKATNLYPPNQLMRGVENTADALERFQQLNRVPNLGFGGPVTPQTPAKFAEGLYGKGAGAYTQGYERTAGCLFYSNNGRCVTGLSEMAHLGEETAKYTAAGTANTAGQWAEKALAEIAAGRGEKVAKYLERLERDLIKSRSMSQLPIDEAFRSELRSMKDLLKKSPGELANVAEDVARMVSRGKMEAAVLGSFENAGMIRRAYLRVMLDGVAAGNKVGALLAKIFKAVGKVASPMQIINGVCFAFAVHETAQAAGSEGALGAIGMACSHLKWLASLGSPLILMELTTEILKEAEAGGYAMAAGSQEAWDLMSGIYSAWGRADVDPDPRRKLTLADMVANFQYENKLEAIVYGQAIRASTRNLGAATGEADMAVAQAIFEKCWPVIRDAWRWERDNLASEYLVMGSEIVHTPIVIYYRPNSPKLVDGEAKVVCEAASADRKMAERIERMAQIIRILYGKGSGVAVNYYWDPKGYSVGDRDWQRGFTYKANGIYPVKVQLAVAPYTSHTKTEPRVMLRREVQAMVDVVVGDERPEICPACGKPAGSNPNCMQCILHKHDPTK